MSVSRAVLITGCSSGIGHATAKLLCREGWTVYATARKPETLFDLEQGGCKTLALDVTDETSMTAAVNTVIESEGAIGVLINNAGYSQSGAVESVPIDQVQIHIPAGPRLGDVVVEADGVRKSYGDRLLIEDLSFKLPRGGLVGVIGPNGAGKTTLMRMIMGTEQADAGALRVGETVKLAYVDQSREELDPDKTVWEEVSAGEEQITLGDRTVNSRAYVAGFNFKGTDQQKKVGKLSGGERNRLHLAKLLRTGGNLLLLDEPTNDLDVDTLRALEEALLSFAGCAVVVSHDRWFLDRIATHVLAFEGESQVRWFEGNFEAYESFRREQLGAEADRPHRITYKKLVRG